MARATYVFLVCQHATEADALADVGAILKLGKTIDANGGAKPLRQAGAIGLAVALAGGALTALFRRAPIRRRAARILSDAIGADAAAAAGRLVKRVTRLDMKQPDDSLNQRHRGRRKVAGVAIKALADAVLTPKKQPGTARLQSVVDAVKKDIERQDAQKPARAERTAPASSCRAELSR